MPRRSQIRRCLTFLLVSSLAATQDASREKVGEVLGRPVYRDDVKAVDEDGVTDQVCSVFLLPLIDEYMASHSAEVRLTAQELAAAAAHFNDAPRGEADRAYATRRLEQIQAGLARPELSARERADLLARKAFFERSAAEYGLTQFLAGHWKFQKHLYDRFGGGRVLWQQGGVEAFDAMRRWIEEQERAGRFRIDDPDLRRSLYCYWTRDHGSFLREPGPDFLQPEWLAQAASQPASRAASQPRE